MKIILKKRKIGTTIVLALTPTIAVAATAGIVVATQLTKKENIVVEKSKIETKDSVATYKFNMANKPDNNQVHVKLVNKATKDLDKVILYTDSTSNAEYPTEDDITVNDDGTFNVPVGLYLATPTSSSSPFDIEMTYTLNGEEKTQTVSNCNLDYKVNYSGDIKDGSYQPSYPVDIPAASHWTSGSEGATYMADCYQYPSIYEEDARYSTSKRIAGIANDDTFKVDSFAAAFNDVVKEEDSTGGYGLHVHMNYQLKGTSDTAIFKFTQTSSSETFEFTNFDCSFTFETANGYTFSKDTSSNVDYIKYILTDKSSHYDLIGRFIGKAHYKITSTTQEHDPIEGDLDYDGLIGDDSSNEGWKPNEIAEMFAAGIIQLTYDFTWGSQETNLSILSPYSKNA